MSKQQGRYTCKASSLLRPCCLRIAVALVLMKPKGEGIGTGAADKAAVTEVCGIYQRRGERAEALQAMVHWKGGQEDEEF